MRLFTAIDLPADVRDRIAELQAPETLDARWSPPDQYHITLRFIGEIDADRADQLEDALGQVKAPTADCSPYGMDVLPSRRNPSVLIVGLERTDSLLSVYQNVSEALEAEGLDPEDRTYRPHVTLARLDNRSPKAVHQFLDATDVAPLPSFRAETFHLYESTLTPDGAIHERRTSFPLTE